MPVMKVRVPFRRDDDNKALADRLRAMADAIEANALGDWVDMALAGKNACVQQVGLDAMYVRIVEDRPKAG